MIGNVNPWFSIWMNPRSTIRKIVKVNPRFSVFPLACLYSLENCFSLSNHWSLGISFPYYVILLSAIFLTPFLAWVWLYFTGWLLSITGKWVRGHAPRSHLRAALAWSKVPVCVSLLLWLIPLLSNPEITFIHIQRNPFSLFTSIISIILSIWSLVLLIQTIREVQEISIGRSFANIISTLAISFVAFFLVFFFSSYIYSIF